MTFVLDILSHMDRKVLGVVAVLAILMIVVGFIKKLSKLVITIAIAIFIATSLPSFVLGRMEAAGITLEDGKVEGVINGRNVSIDIDDLKGISVKEIKKALESAR